MDVRVQGDEAQITLNLRDLEDILVDLKYVTNYERLEPRTQDLIDALRDKGVTWG